jgi:endonuclease/exonuclease/phosphatase family metal-dependent hydrolase
VRVLTWNLFHGRGVPGAGRSLLPGFSDALAGWEWDVALLQEVPPWWPAPLAAACAAEERHALTSRNGLLPLRRFLAERWPDVMKSQGGGCNAILVRGEAIAEHRELELRRRPERRVAHGVRLAASGAWVVNLHATAHVPAHAQEDLDKARAAALAWAGDAPLVLGGDLNLRAPRAPGFVPVAARDVDHLVVRGLSPEGSAEVLPHGSLSDHPPLVLSLAVP